MQIGVEDLFWKLRYRKQSRIPAAVDFYTVDSFRVRNPCAMRFPGGRKGFRSTLDATGEGHLRGMIFRPLNRQHVGWM